MPYCLACGGSFKELSGGLCTQCLADRDTSRPPKPNPRRTNGSLRNKVRARLRARRDDCALCGKPIDYSLPPGHPMCFECDEIVPVSKGGSPYDPSNLQAAHRICNQRKGDGTRRAGGKPRGPLPVSRKW